MGGKMCYCNTETWRSCWVLVLHWWRDGWHNMCFPTCCSFELATLSGWTFNFPTKTCFSTRKHKFKPPCPENPCTIPCQRRNSYNLQTYAYVIQYKSCCKRRIKPGRSCFCVIRNLLHPLDKKHNNFWLNCLPKINTNNKSSTSEASKQMQGWRIICGNLAELVRNADSEWDKSWQTNTDLSRHRLKKIKNQTCDSNISSALVWL